MSDSIVKEKKNKIKLKLIVGTPINFAKKVLIHSCAETVMFV